MTIKDAWNFAVTGPWEETAATDTEYKIVEDGDTIKIAFQGSSEFAKNGEIMIDWKQNFNFWPKRTEECDFAHRGFYDKLMSVWGRIINRLPYGKKIEVYGFSQGAALAVITYRKLKLLGHQVKCIVFGCPRVFWGFPDEQEGFYDDLLRVEVKGDAVTRVPFAWWGFRHVGKVKLIDSVEQFWNLYRKHMIIGRLVGGLDLLGGK